MNFEWEFEENAFMEAQNSKEEDDIFGWVYIKTADRKYIVDIHKEYYNSKDRGYDLEVYYENEDGSHGRWLGSVKSIRSVSSMCDPLGKFKKRAEKALTIFIEEFSAS